MSVLPASRSVVCLFLLSLKWDTHNYWCLFAGELDQIYASLFPCSQLSLAELSVFVHVSAELGPAAFCVKGS